MDLQAIFDNWRRTVSDHYFDLHGRVGRGQFWYFVLANIAIAIVVAIIQSVVFLPLLALFNLAMLLPSAGMGARRLQDTGRDGKLIWIFLIAGFISQVIAAMAMLGIATMGFLAIFFFGPLVMLINLAFLVACIVLIYFWVQPGDPGDNAYGPPPPVFDPSQRVPSTPA
jgi:uncharacterized membrane protein YhaH (DUF805 family)